MTESKVFIVGFGNVGRSLLRLMIERNLIDGIIKIVGIADSKGCVVKEDGFSKSELQELLRLPRGKVSTLKPYGKPGIKYEDVIDDVDFNVLIELTPSNYESGEPGISNVKKSIERGKHVVTANKGPLALLGRRIIEEAKRRKVKLLYRATVMGGTPLIPLIYSIRNSVKRVWGILNGTTNFILTLMHEKNVEFNEALSEAQRLGIAEANPSLDIDGFDPAAKIAIIACTMGFDVTINDVERESLSQVTLEDIRKAEERKCALKYIASLEIVNRESNELRLSVKIEEVPFDEKLAKVRGSFNGVYIETFENKIYLEGLGAGGRPTAEAVLEDLLSITRGDENGYCS